MAMKARWVLFFLFPALALAQSASQASGDAQGIHKLVSEFMGAWNHHDAQAFAETFAEDADFTNVVGASAHGRHAVEDFHAPAFATRFKNTHQTAHDVKIRFITPSIASVDVQWEMTGAMDTDGTPIPVRQGLLSWIATKQGDRWLITVMHNQELTPRKSL
jgi:uncharacterized protein (TIGR02246 family)